MESRKIRERNFFLAKMAFSGNRNIDQLPYATSILKTGRHLLGEAVPKSALLLYPARLAGPALSRAKVSVSVGWLAPMPGATWAIRRSEIRMKSKDCSKNQLQVEID